MSETHAPEKSQRPLQSALKAKSDFLDYLLLERGFSPNTLASYGTDVQHLLTHLETKGLELTRVASDDIRDCTTYTKWESAAARRRACWPA